MKLCRPWLARTALLFFAASAFLFLLGQAQQPAEATSQPATADSTRSQQTPAITRLPKPKRVKMSSKPGPEDTLPACTPVKQAEFHKDHQDPDPEIKPPHLLEFAEARYTKEARKKHIQGESEIGFTVTTEGLPTDMCLLQSLGYGLDEEASLAVRHYRFAPATRDGKPIAVPIRVEVRFRLY